MEETLHHLRTINFFGTCSTPLATPRFNIAKGYQDEDLFPVLAGTDKSILKLGVTRGGTHMGRRKLLSGTHLKVVQSLFHEL